MSAISKDSETGVVIIDEEVCIGCRSCESACPYGVPQYDETAGFERKCDFCSDLLAAGENPACVDSCPQRVLEYGDIDELVNKYPDAVRDLPILPKSSETGPATIIIPRAAALEGEPVQKHV